MEASRSIMFDVRSEIGKNFGVLFAWICVSVLFPVDSLVSRRRAERRKGWGRGVECLGSFGSGGLVRRCNGR